MSKDVVLVLLLALGVLAGVVGTTVRATGEPPTPEQLSTELRQKPALQFGQRARYLAGDWSGYEAFNAICRPARKR